MQIPKRASQTTNKGVKRVSFTIHDPHVAQAKKHGDPGARNGTKRTTENQPPLERNSMEVRSTLPLTHAVQHVTKVRDQWASTHLTASQLDRSHLSPRTTRVSLWLKALQFGMYVTFNPVMLDFSFSGSSTDEVDCCIPPSNSTKHTASKEEVP